MMKRSGQKLYFITILPPSLQPVRNVLQLPFGKSFTDIAKMRESTSTFKSNTSAVEMEIAMETVFATSELVTASTDTAERIALLPLGTNLIKLLKKT